MELDKLLVRIEADLSDLKRGLDKANNQVKRSSKGMSNDMQRFGNMMDRVGKRVLTFGTLLAGAFGAYQIKQVVDVGRQIEDLQVRLKALFGTAEEGAKAFDVMVKFASKVPFTLDEIQGASGNLAVVAEDAKELAELLEITGNVAGATGLSFQQTAEQIQRSFSGGIASADVFREKGVRSMLGFQVGAEVSINETVKRFKEVFGKGGEFGNVTNDLANTLTGTLSMLQDKLFQFRKAIADEFMVVLKQEFRNLNIALENSEQKIVEYGKAIGEALGETATFIAKNIDEITKSLQILGLFLATAVGKTIFNFFKSLPIFISALTGAGALLISFGDDLQKFAERNREAIAMMAIALGNAGLATRLLSKETQNLSKHDNDIRGKFSTKVFDERIKELQKMQKNIEDAKEKSKEFIITEGELKEITQGVTEAFEDAGKSISEAFGKAISSGENFKESMKKVFESLIAKITETIFQILIIEPLIKSLTKSLEDMREGFEKSRDAQRDSMVMSAIGGVTSMLGFANGGYTPPNKPYMVGERGAEVFVPRTAGNIVPNNQLGGGVTVNQNVSFSTGVVPTVRAEVMNLLPTIKQETVNAVAEARSRGGSFSRTFGA